MAFQSAASDLVPGDTNGRVDVFVRDRRTGVVTRASVSGTGEQALGDSGEPAISGNGRYVAFTSSASTLVSKTWNGEPAGGVEPTITPDGRFVAYSTWSTVMKPGEDNRIGNDVYVYDTKLGTNELISAPADPTNTGDGGSARPSITPDGRYVAFESFAWDLTTGDTNDEQDIFRRDRWTSTTTRISAGAADSSWGAAITADGQQVPSYRQTGSGCRAAHRDTASTFETFRRTPSA